MNGGNVWGGNGGNTYTIADRDWIGNNASTYATLGASNHSNHERQEHDYYATDPVAVKMLAQTGFFAGVKSVWECACGGGGIWRHP